MNFGWVGPTLSMDLARSVHITYERRVTRGQFRQSQWTLELTRTTSLLATLNVGGCQGNHNDLT